MEISEARGSCLESCEFGLAATFASAQADRDQVLLDLEELRTEVATLSEANLSRLLAEVTELRSECSQTQASLQQALETQVD